MKSTVTKNPDKKPSRSAYKPILSKDEARAIDRMVGRRIRMARRERGISQQVLAGMVGVSFQQVQKYENGCNRVSASMLVMVAGALGMSPHDLIPERCGGMRGGLPATQDPEPLSRQAVSVARHFDALPNDAARYSLSRFLKSLTM